MPDSLTGKQGGEGEKREGQIDKETVLKTEFKKD